MDWLICYAKLLWKLLHWNPNGNFPNEWMVGYEWCGKLHYSIRIRTRRSVNLKTIYLMMSTTGGTVTMRSSIWATGISPYHTLITYWKRINGYVVFYDFDKQSLSLIRSVCNTDIFSYVCVAVCGNLILNSKYH